MRRRLADPAGRDLLVADMDQAARNVPVVSTTRPAAMLPAIAEHEAARRGRSPIEQQILGRAFDDVEVRRFRPAIAAIACAIELAVGLGARARAPPAPCCG